jgi:hypothetical protein
MTLIVQRDDELDIEKHFAQVLDFYINGKNFKQNPFHGPTSNGRDV